jgi:hypothetical protein
LPVEDARVMTEKDLGKYRLVGCAFISYVRGE